MITRRRLLGTAGIVAGGVAASALAGCTPAPDITRPSASPGGPVRAQLDQVLTTIADGNEQFGVWVEDLRSGGTYSFNGEYSSQSASMAKPMIVSMALRRAAADGGPLSRENVENAGRAIRNSDNDAADALWAYAGGRPAYDALAKDLGLTGTHSDPARDFWSWTWTTPRDQVRLVGALAAGGTPALTDEQCRFVYDLMGQVQDDQAWGVGQPKSPGVTVHLKNGWVQFQSTDKLWAVNSMGGVQGDDRDYRLCVMTRLPDFPTGREITTEVGKWVFSILGSGRL